MIYLLFYDISDTLVRTKVVKLIEQEGFERIQLSVFVAPFNPFKSKLWTKLQELIAKCPTDKIYCLKLTRENFYGIKIIGRLDFDLQYLAGEASSLIC